MDRSRAVHLVVQLLRRLTAGRDAWPLRLITELRVFGSLARGALEPHDVDLAVEIDRDDRWAHHFVDALTSGRDPYAVIRRPLTGGSRGCQFLFEAATRVDFPLTLPLRRGEAIWRCPATVARDPG